MGVTQKQIAASLGITQAQVSWSLNGSSLVSAMLRKRVVDYCDMVGYQPHHAARSLQSRNTNMLGLMMGEPHLLLSEVHARRVVSLQMQAQAMGYGLEISITTGLVRAVAEKRADAFILMGEPYTRAQWDGIRPLICKTPIITIDQWDCENPGNAVVFSDTEAIHSAVQELVVLGHRRIAFWGHVKGSSESQRRLDAWEWTHVTEQPGWDGIAANPEMYAFALGDAMDSGITAFVCVQDTAALTLLWLLKERGLSVPEDVSVISFDGSLHSRYSTPPLDSIIQDTDRMALAVMSMIPELRGRGGGRVESVSIPCRMIRRGSIGPIKTISR